MSALRPGAPASAAHQQWRPPASAVPGSAYGGLAQALRNVSGAEEAQDSGPPVFRYQPPARGRGGPTGPGYHQHYQYGSYAEPEPPSPLDKWHDAFLQEEVAMPTHLEVAEKVSAQLRESTVPPDHKLGHVKRVLLHKNFGFITPAPEAAPGVVLEDDEDEEDKEKPEGAAGPPQKRAKLDPGGPKKDLFFLLGHVTGAKPQEGDFVSYRITSGKQGLMACEVSVIREAAQQFSQATVDAFLDGVYESLDGRCMLVYIMEQWSTWKKVLQSKGLSPANIQTLLRISSRSRLPNLMMKTALSAFYTSILNSAFVKVTLPYFVRNRAECTPSVIEDVERFCQLLHDNCSGRLCAFMHTLIQAVVAWYKARHWEGTDLEKLAHLATLYTNTEEEKKAEQAGRFCSL